jgi:cyclophilin family peptidyl-prolyl cis-trans isomerase
MTGGKRIWCQLRVNLSTVAMLSTSVVAAQPVPPKPALAPSEIVAAAPASDWVAIAPSDLLVMDLAPNSNGSAKRVVIQLMPPPFSQGWVGNIRKLAAAHWWDGTSINRVQDNYVVQWGDATEKKALPKDLVTLGESVYTSADDAVAVNIAAITVQRAAKTVGNEANGKFDDEWRYNDSYSSNTFANEGWPIASDGKVYWPVHCYGMVGVGRDMPPDTGTGAELYTVIGHAPRHLDRNIALVGRVISGIENLSSLPRGTGPLGFYEKPEERVTITSIRLGNEVKDLPRYQYLSTESASFARYADARANRRDPFFIQPAGGADICNIPVPVRIAP